MEPFLAFSLGKSVLYIVFQLFLLRSIERVIANIVAKLYNIGTTLSLRYNKVGVYLFSYLGKLRQAEFLLIL